MKNHNSVFNAGLVFSLTLPHPSFTNMSRSAQTIRIEHFLENGWCGSAFEVFDVFLVVEYDIICKQNWIRNQSFQLAGTLWPRSYEGNSCMFLKK